MILSLIAALSRNRCIGRNNDLPWQLPDDLAFFKKTTLGHPMIMGRKTWEALGGPLPKRAHLVVSRQADYPLPEGKASLYPNLSEALAAARELDEQEVFVIGGGELFAQALPLADRLYLTEIDAEVEGDAFFPALPEGAFQRTVLIDHPADERHVFAFQVCMYERVRG